jgi:predicted Zn-dependent protease
MATIGAGATSMAQRGFLRHSRAFESSADQAALRYLEKAGLDPTGLKTFLQKLEGQELRPESQQSEYVRSHPLTRDRVLTIENHVSGSSNRGKAMPERWVQQHRMMMAKLVGFITPQQVVWQYDDRDKSIESVAARAIAAYRLNEVERALTLANELLAREPENPYFHELKGQMLMDFGRVAEAIPFYEKAVRMLPDAGLIRTALAHAQIETAGTKDNARLEKAAENLSIALKSEPRSTRIHRLLATAYGRLGQESRAKLHLAEEALLQRRFDYAKQQAETARKGLKSGSPDWIRAGDILNYVSYEKGRKDGGDGEN